MHHKSHPFAYSQEHGTKAASGNTSYQLARMPWQTPTQKLGRPRVITISNPVGTAGALHIWDQDLSNTTPPTTGSAGDGVLILEFGASGASGSAVKTTTYGPGYQPIPDAKFVAGIAFQVTQPGVKVFADVDYY